MRRILAATLIGVLTGSLLTTVEPIISTPSPAQAAPVTVGGCEVAVGVAGAPLTGTGSTPQIGAAGNNPSHVVVSEESGECILQFVQPMVEMVWSFPYPLTQFDVLIVGGGGSGSVGGGGAGGYYDTFSDSNNPAIQVPSGAESATIRVGQGGQKVSGNVNGNDGAHSGLYFDTYSGNSSDIFSDGGSTTPKNPTVSADAIVMAGGGGGAKNPGMGRPGGSGGGSVNDSSGGAGVNGASALSAGSAGGFGNQGGGANGCQNNTGGGGGGGAGGRTGSNTICGPSVYKGGAGGEGRSSSITGSSITYAGGGGGSFSGGGGTTSGGSGGGGDGDNGTSNSDGTDRRGGGGGGDTTPANTGSGGDGIVVLRIPLPPLDPAPVLGSVTRTDGGFSVPVSNAGAYPGGVSLSASVATGSGGSTPSVEIDGVASGSFPVAVSSLSGGVVTVSGLDPGESSVLTVEASQAGFSPASVSVTGVAKTAQASLSITGSDSLRFGGSITVAASGGSGSGGVTFGLSSGDCVLDTNTLVLSSCPASSSWQGFFSFEVGDGGVGQAEVHVHRPVPGDRFVRADGVVLGPVVLGPLDERQGVGDLIKEQSLVLQRPEPAFA